jgi:hypothetical protein
LRQIETHYEKLTSRYSAFIAPPSKPGDSIDLQDSLITDLKNLKVSSRIQKRILQKKGAM